MKIILNDYEDITFVMDDVEYIIKKKNIGFTFFKVEDEYIKKIYEE